MGLYDPKKKEGPGLSNDVAKDNGYPSSGAISANQGTLPLQLKQEPYQHMSNGAGGLSGPDAVQGAQFKTTAQPMSSGVASYVGIPTSMAPKKHKFGYGGGADEAEAAKQLPDYGSPSQFGEQGSTYGPGGVKFEALDQGAAAADAPAAAGPPKWTPLGDIDKMRHGFDRGSDYDIQARRDLSEQMAAASRADAIQNAVAGRGSSVGQVSSDFSNLNAMGDYEGQRAMRQTQAEQQAFNNQMAYTQMVIKTKSDLVIMGKEMGLTISDQDYNQLAAEMLEQTGQMPSESEILQKLQERGGKKTLQVGTSQKYSQISQLMDSYDWNKEERAAAILDGMTDAEVAQFAAQWPNTAKRMISESWGDTLKKVQQKFDKAGVVL